MPFLDAKALETDPDGMAFLRAVITPQVEQGKPALPRPVRQEPAPFEAAKPGRMDLAPPPIRSEPVLAPAG